MDLAGPVDGRATIGDVAARAGVSVATVSRALRGLPNVAASTRQRIERVADDLRYRPDPAAARLAVGHTNTIMIGVPALNGWYFSNVVAGAERACREGGYEIQVVCLGSQDDLDRLVDRSSRIERRTDGLVLVDIDIDTDTVDDLRGRGVAVGTVGFRVEGCPAIQLDDVGVGRLAGDHLMELGCERPAIIAGLPDDPIRHRVPDLRRAGFEQAIGAAGLRLDGRIAATEFGVAGGRAAMAALLTGRTPADRPDGVFAMSDELAFGALMELRARHIRVGRGRDAIAVIGVDDHEFSQVVDLTTVRQEVVDHGVTIARRLIDASDAVRRTPGVDRCTDQRRQPIGVDPEVIRPEVSLVRRATTAPIGLN